VHEDMLTKGVELLQAWDRVRHRIWKWRPNTTFKLGKKVSNKGKHLNHLRWIIRNMNKYKPSQAQGL